MNQIPTLTKAINDHGYVTLKDLANAILDVEDENNALAGALSAVLKDFDEGMEAEGFGIDSIPSVITARALLQQREQRAADEIEKEREETEIRLDREWLKETTPFTKQDFDNVLRAICPECKHLLVGGLCANDNCSKYVPLI